MEKVAKHAGVYTHTGCNDERTFYIIYRLPGGRSAKLVKEPVGKVSTGMTAAKAAQIRADRMRGKEMTNTERRAAEEAARRADDSRWPLARIWEAYRESRPDNGNRSIDETRFNTHLRPRRHGGQRTDYRRIARRVKAVAQLPKDFRPLHGLRHNYASRLASSGQVDMYTLQKLLTHESPAMTQRYAHLHDDALRKAAAVADVVLMPVKQKRADS